LPEIVSVKLPEVGPDVGKMLEICALAVVERRTTASESRADDPASERRIM
jgi:hypothetical protein